MAGPRPGQLERLSDGSIDTARVFFALWPAASLAGELAAVARKAMRECGGKAVPERNIHLTLVFIGDIAREQLALLETAASRVLAEPVSVALDRFGYWRHNRVLWAGPAEAPQPLLVLIERLGTALREAGVRFDARKYAPHVTLLRHALRPPASLALALPVWQAAEFVLAESARVDGRSAYVPVARWPLTGGALKT